MKLTATELEVIVRALEHNRMNTADEDKREMLAQLETKVKGYLEKEKATAQKG